MRTRLILVATLVAATVLLTGCQGSEPGAAEESPTASPSSEPAAPTSEASEPETPESSPTPEETVLEISIDGDSVKPSGARVEAGVGEPISLQITADRAGELHVHSTPEQEIPFKRGTTSKRLVIEQPGVVEVEDHDSGLVIVQLEVS